ncbi:hypothetical protein AB0M48_10700 [Lentzea sp. NPDC051208]|uniref:hypothetical protein n=1 Tax=Lentzea sp. NPDC051208 TaxID=3154642 RepID=UPI003443968B
MRAVPESVRGWVDRDLAVEPLPYRRVLGEEEAASWARRLEERWGSRRPLWDPQIDGDVPEGLLVLQTPAMGRRPRRRADAQGFAGERTPPRDRDQGTRHLGLPDLKALWPDLDDWRWTAPDWY